MAHAFTPLQIGTNVPEHFLSNVAIKQNAFLDKIPSPIQVTTKTFKGIFQDITERLHVNFEIITYWNKITQLG